MVGHVRTLVDEVVASATDGSLRVHLERMSRAEVSLIVETPTESVYLSIWSRGMVGMTVDRERRTAQRPRKARR